MTATRLAGPSATNAELAVGAEANADRLDQLLCKPRHVERDLMRDHVLDRVDDADRSADLGRHPELRAVLRVLGVARTRVGTRMLATDFLFRQSMRCAMLVVSEVLTTIEPSGLTATPSGSTPTGNSLTTLRVAMSIAVSSASFSLATKTSFPSGLTRNCSGSGPDGSSPTSFKRLGVDDRDGVVVAEADEHQRIVLAAARCRAASGRS